MNGNPQSGVGLAEMPDAQSVPTLSVVIPALNEQDGIAAILARILAVEEDLRDVGIKELEVIVVDDGSEDATSKIVEQTEGVRLVEHGKNRGYGAALKTGFCHATGDLLAFLDADSTYPPEHLVKLCEIAIRDRADVVIGSRRSGDQTSMPAVRRLGNFIWSSLLTLLGSARVQDPASGMRVFRRAALYQLYPLPDGLNFTPVMSTRALHENLRVVETPIPYMERSGHSKLSVVRDGTRFLSTIIWTAFQYNPARILELIGLGALGASGAIGLSFIAARLSGVTELDPFGVFGAFAGLVLGIGGISVFSLGISFNHLVSLFHKRPVRQSNFARSLGLAPERHFGWLGLVMIGGGMTLGSVSLFLGLQGWEITRLWLWLLGSAVFFLMGLQLILFWILIKVLDTLNARDSQIDADLTTAGHAVAPIATQPVPLASRPI